MLFDGQPKSALCVFRTLKPRSYLGVISFSSRRHYANDQSSVHFEPSFSQQATQSDSRPPLTIRREAVSKQDYEDPFRPNRQRPVSGPQSDRNRRSQYRGRHLVAGEVRYSLLGTIIREQFASYRHHLRQLDAEHVELEGLGIKGKDELEQRLSEFEIVLQNSCRQASERQGSGDALFLRLRAGFLTKQLVGLREELRHGFTNHVLTLTFSKDDIKNQKRLADLRYPIEWYPATRAMQRKIHLHVGPTNSGKTYHALKRLESAESGLYAGPLRLLAHEVYTRLNAKGKPCALITGEERRFPDDQSKYFSSCTVEMVPLNTEVDVAVIDEIQMMGDKDRGWAWTQALLGVQAHEVHICGEMRTIPLIEDLCTAMGDDLIIHKYERLNPLLAPRGSLKGDLKRLEKGDCVIVFSRFGIHQMKKEVEAATGKRCAVVYGSLPPEIRAQQAKLFNDPNNDYDFLVASDAVGMGLNLSIKRIIFEATSKHDGTAFRTIQDSEIKQIGGRAGRFKTASEDIPKSKSKTEENSPTAREIGEPSAKKSPGYVLALEDFDVPTIQRAMNTEVAPLATAGVYPPMSLVVQFAGYFPQNTPLSYVLLRLVEISTIHPRFHLCRFRDQLAIADAIQSIDMTLADRIIFTAAPANIREDGMARIVQAFARCVADQTGGDLVDLKELDLELLDSPGEGKHYLRKLESLHKALTLYLWLSYRFAGAFKSQGTAFYVKSLVEEKIDKALTQVAIIPERRFALTRLRQEAVSKGNDEVSDIKKDPEEAEVALPLSWEDEDHQEPLMEIPDGSSTQSEARL